MELRQLEYFAAVARHRHFTRAADALYVTQSALSQQVRRLEEELGLALLLRTSRGVELTAAGEDLLARAESILAEVERARTNMDEHAGVSRGLVRVAATTGDAVRLPQALAEFHAEHPGVRIGLRQGSARRGRRARARGRRRRGGDRDAGRRRPGLKSTVVAEERLCVMCPPGDPLATAGPRGGRGPARPRPDPCRTRQRVARGGGECLLRGGLQPGPAVRGERPVGCSLPHRGRARREHRAALLGRTARAAGGSGRAG